MANGVRNESKHYKDRAHHVSQITKHSREGQDWNGVDRGKARNERPRDRLRQSSGMGETGGQINLESKTKFTGTKKNKGLLYYHREKQSCHVISVFKNVLRQRNLVTTKLERKTF